MGSIPDVTGTPPSAETDSPDTTKLGPSFVIVLRAGPHGSWRASLEREVQPTVRHEVEKLRLVIETMTSPRGIIAAEVPFGLGPGDALAGLLEKLRTYPHPIDR